MGKRLMVGMILMTPNADPTTDNSCIINSDAVIATFTVPTPAEGAKYAAALSSCGFDRIELCPAFDDDAVSLVKDAVRGRALVGVVRF